VKYFIRVVRATGRALACGNDVESEVNRARVGAAEPPEFGFEDLTGVMHLASAGVAVLFAGLDSTLDPHP
jgi:hypothetical protein